MKTFESLNRIPSTPQEMVGLRERMETLSVKESLILSAALMGKPACDARGVINIFQSMPDYEVCYPAGSYEALGRFCLRYDANSLARLMRMSIPVFSSGTVMWSTPIRIPPSATTDRTSRPVWMTAGA